MHCRTFTQPWCTVGTGWFMWSMCLSTSSTSPTVAMPSSPCSLTSCTVQVYTTGSHAPGHKNTLIQTGGWRWGKQSPGQYHWLTNQRSILCSPIGQVEVPATLGHPRFMGRLLDVVRRLAAPVAILALPFGKRGFLWMWTLPCCKVRASAILSKT